MVPGLLPIFLKPFGAGPPGVRKLEASPNKHWSPALEFATNRTAFSALRAAQVKFRATQSNPDPQTSSNI